MRIMLSFKRRHWRAAFEFDLGSRHLRNQTVAGFVEDSNFSPAKLSVVLRWLTHVSTA